MNKKNSFLLYTKHKFCLDILNLEQKGILMDAIFSYANDEEFTIHDSSVKMAFGFMRQGIDENAERWNEEKNRRVEAGRMGGLARQAKLSNAKHRLDTQATLSKVSDLKKCLANQAVSVSVSVSEDLDNKLSPSVLNSVRACKPKIFDDGDDIYKNNFYQKNETVENVDTVKNSVSTFEPFTSQEEKPKPMLELLNNFAGVVKKDYKAEMQRLPAEWENISYGCLESINFGHQEITKLFKKDPLPPEAVQRSINSFSEQLKNPDAKKYADPLGMLVGTLMTGAEWKYQNLDVPKKEIVLETKQRFEGLEREKEIDDRIKKENADRIEKINKPRREECQKWFDSLDEKEKSVIPKTMVSHLESIRKAEIFKYYEENIENKAKE